MGIYVCSYICVVKSIIYVQAVTNYFKKNWINSSIEVQVLKRKVVFDAPDAVAELYVVDKLADSKIIKLLEDKKVTY